MVQTFLKSELLVRKQVSIVSTNILEQSFLNTSDMMDRRAVGLYDETM